jgi:glycosyltransferase involved in cell wall biosynthesis
VHNGGILLEECLASLSGVCDEICAVDDRSSDSSYETLTSCEAVTNIFRVPLRLGRQPWVLGETPLLNLLYRMADLCGPDWIVMLDHDQYLEDAHEFRLLLESSPRDVAGYELRLQSVWLDPEYPRLVPLLGTAETRSTRVWRHRPGLEPGQKWLHNGVAPSNLRDFGATLFASTPRVIHSGWSTLAARIEKVDFYSSLDPDYTWNDGVPYDRGLLFGFSRSELDKLRAAYRVRMKDAP